MSWGPSMAVKSFVIDRKTWLNGGQNHNGASMLRNSAGRQCCLGFYGAACGLTPEQMLEVSDPSGIGGDWVADIPEEMQWLVATAAERGGYPYVPEEAKVPSVKAAELIQTNDAGRFLLDREGMIIALFADQGITVTFDG